MQAQTWTVIGLLAATLFAVLFYLGAKIDSLGSSVNGRIDGLSSRVDTLSERMSAQGLELSRAIYEVAGKLDEHLRRHAG